jgi:GNAT superfamily N-acetyltransferase
MTVEILPVRSERDKRDFYRFPWRVYQGDPSWVPPLWPQRKAYLDRKAPFFGYGDGDFWLARSHGNVVGTIGAGINRLQNQELGTRSAVFGFFEVLPDGYETACSLWDHVCAWARARGMTAIHGPYSFAPSEENGFLIEGFQYIPPIMTAHTPPYYAAFAEHYGFQKESDSLAYRYDFSQIGFDTANAPPVVHRIASRFARRHGSQFLRTPRMEEWALEIPRLHALYNKSLAVLPDYSPMDFGEFEAQALALKPLIDPETVFIAEVDGKTVGLALGIPNYTEALRLANGLQRPWDYLRLALARRRIKGLSFKILVIDPEHWGYGLETAMILEMGKAILRKGYAWADGSLTGETNPQTNKIAQRLGARIYRRYRVYQLNLAS